MANKAYIHSLIGNNFSDSDLVGKLALELSNLSKNNVPISEGFVISGFVFDEFIVANDIVGFIVEQLEVLSEKPKLARKIAKDIRQRIDAGKIPSQMHDELEAHYKSLSKSNPAIVNLQTSPLNDHLNERLSIGQEYLYSDVSGFENLIKIVKQAWADLFNEEMLTYRNNVEYEGNLSQPLIVQKSANAEVSGVLYNFDINTGNNNDTTIIASLGISKNRVISPAYTFSGGLPQRQQADNKESDYYLIRKSNGNVISKIDNTQKFMWIRSNPREGGELTQVKISKTWSERLKVDDILQKKLMSLVDLIAKTTTSKFEADWTYESGKFMITSIFDIPAGKERVLPEIAWNNQLSEETQIIHAAAPEKPLEIMKKNDALDFLKEHKDEFVLTEVEREEKSEAVKEMFPEAKTITEVWWDKRKQASEIKVFANNIEGYGVFNFSEIAKVLAIEDIDRLHDLKRVQKQVCEYIAIYLVAAAPNPVFIQLDRQLKFEGQLEVLGQLRNLYGHKNFWVILPEIRDVEEIAQYKKLLFSSGFRRTNLFKIFQLISQPLFLANLPELIEQNIDGIVVDIDMLYSNLIGDVKHHPEGSNLELLLNFLIDNLVEKSQTKLFTYVKTESQPLLESMLDDLLENGINGIIYKENDLYEFKQMLVEKESHILTQSLKKIKAKLHKKRGKKK